MVILSKEEQLQLEFDFEVECDEPQTFETLNDDPEIWDRDDIIIPEEDVDEGE